MYEFIGALLVTYVLTQGIFVLSRRKTSAKNATIIALASVLLLVLVLTPLTFGLLDGLKLYLPGLVLWLLVNQFRTAKHDSGVQ